MGIFDMLVKTAESAIKGASDRAGVGAGSLASTADPKKTTNNSGVYLLSINGDVKKAGSASIGVQKRMQQYYGLNERCGINHHINESNRDSVRVKWQSCRSSDCDELESKLNDKYENNNSMEWSERRPRSTRDSVALKI